MTRRALLLLAMFLWSGSVWAAPSVRQVVRQELERVHHSGDLATGLAAMARVVVLARSNPEAGRLFRAGLARLARGRDPRLRLLRGLTLLQQRPRSKRGRRFVEQGAARLDGQDARLLAGLLAPMEQPAPGRRGMWGRNSGPRFDARPLWRQLTAPGSEGLVQPALEMLVHHAYRSQDPRAQGLVDQASRGLGSLPSATRRALFDALVSCAVSPGAGKLRQDVFGLLGRHLPRQEAEIALGPGTMAANLGKQTGAFSYMLWPNLRWISRSDLDLGSFGRAFTRVAASVGRIHFDVTDHLGDEARFRQQMARARGTRFSQIHDGRTDAPYVTSKELYEVLTSDALLAKTSLYRRDRKGRFHPLPAEQVQRLARLARP